MRPMSTEQSKYPSPEGSSEPNHADNRGFTIPNHIYGFHHETTRVGGIRLHLDHYGPRLYKNANRDTLQRNDNG